MMPKDPPEFEDGDHAKLWNKIHENSEAIAGVEGEMKWVRRLLVGTFVGVIITILASI